MPDGRSGVVYGGDVYPLHAGNPDFIDLTDPAVPKDRCTKWVSEFEPLVYANTGAGDTSRVVPSKWSIESNRFGHYVVFDGGEQDAEQVVAALEEASLEIVRWDVSSRPAEDGYFYDWFIRLNFDGSSAACRNAVADALEIPTKRADEAKTDSLADGLAQLRFWRSTITTLTVERDAAAARADVHEQALQAAEKTLKTRDRTIRALRADAKAHQETLDRLTAQHQALTQSSTSGSKQVTALRGQLDEANAAVAEQARKVAQLQEDVDLAAEWASRQEQELLAAKQVEADLRAENNELHADAEERAVLAELVPARPAARQREDLLARSAWKRLILHDQALVAMRDPQQYRKHDALMAALHALDNGTPKGISPWAGTGIVEVKDTHIATGVPGTASGGRLYYRELEDGNLLVFTQIKTDPKAQKEFVARIDKLARAHAL